MWRDTLPPPSSRQQKSQSYLKRLRPVMLLALGLSLLWWLGHFFHLPGRVWQWSAFSLAAYAVIGNDSIQTIGTFLSSNRGRSWQSLWAFLSLVLIATLVCSWYYFDGDLSYGRLASKGLEQEPVEISYMQMMAPCALLLLTRLNMPVSTTLLILSGFSTSTSTIGAIVGKSFAGYVVAFVLALLLWGSFSEWLSRPSSKERERMWQWFQGISTTALWSIWLMQDAANVAVYLPRHLNLMELLGALLVLLLCLAWMLRRGGESIQELVDEKSATSDPRSATWIDLLYALILWGFQVATHIPMSTTTVFVGLLWGRELALALRGQSTRSWRAAMNVAGSDLGIVTIGFFASMILASTMNHALATQILQLVFNR